MTDIGRITSHYATDAIADRVLAMLRAQAGPDVAVTPEALAPIDHFHGRGLAATREAMALLAPAPGQHLLDIGCGIGGPARWIAATFKCRVTGIDITPEFCAAARALTAATGQSDTVAIVDGSATDLPFADATFDAAYSQNVIMNIADPRRFYAEACRVLKPGGRAVFSNIGRGTGGPPHYPVPWAATAETSFLSSLDETRAAIEGAGFEIVSLDDVTPRVLPDLLALAAKSAGRGLPRLGVHAFMGERMRDYSANTTRNLVEGRTILIEALVARPR